MASRTKLLRIDVPGITPRQNPQQAVLPQGFTVLERSISGLKIRHWETGGDSSHINTKNLEFNHVTFILIKLLQNTLHKHNISTITHKTHSNTTKIHSLQADIFAKMISRPQPLGYLPWGGFLPLIEPSLFNL